MTVYDVLDAGYLIVVFQLSFGRKLAATVFSLVSKHYHKRNLWNFSNTHDTLSEVHCMVSMVHPHS